MYNDISRREKNNFLFLLLLFSVCYTWIVFAEYLHIIYMADGSECKVIKCGCFFLFSSFSFLAEFVFHSILCDFAVVVVLFWFHRFICLLFFIFCSSVWIYCWWSSFLRKIMPPTKYQAKWYVVCTYITKD